MTQVTLSNGKVIDLLNPKKDRTISSVENYGGKYHINTPEEQCLSEGRYWYGGACHDDPQTIDPVIHLEFNNGTTDGYAMNLTDHSIVSGSRPGTSGYKLRTSVNYSEVAIVPTNPADTNLGTGDFTLEFWFYATGISSGWRMFQLGSHYMVMNTTGSLHYRLYSPSELLFSQRATTHKFQSNVWRHWALTRQGNTFRVFENGTLQCTANSGTSVGYNGANLFLSKSIRGDLDGIRLLKGHCAYTGNFTPVQGAYPLIYV